MSTKSVWKYRYIKYRCENICCLYTPFLLTASLTSHNISLEFKFISSYDVTRWNYSSSLWWLHCSQFHFCWLKHSHSDTHTKIENSVQVKKYQSSHLKKSQTARFGKVKKSSTLYKCFLMKSKWQPCECQSHKAVLYSTNCATGDELLWRYASWR